MRVLGLVVVVVVVGMMVVAPRGRCDEGEDLLEFPTPWR